MGLFNNIYMNFLRRDLSKTKFDAMVVSASSNVSVQGPSIRNNDAHINCIVT